MPKYSAVLMDHFSAPRNAGSLESPDCIGTAGTPGQGPFMVFHFKLVDGVIAEVRYQTYGCGPAIAAGSVLTTLMRNQSVAHALALTQSDVERALGGLPPDKQFCAGLAIEAVRNGLGSMKG